MYKKWGYRVEAIYRRWQDIRTVAVLAPPSRYVFSKEQFFDSPYHLNAVGRANRTQRIIEDLGRYISNSKSCDRRDSMSERESATYR
jgi:hypothetical protein